MKHADDPNLPISAAEFRERLVAVCRRAGVPGLPRKTRDRHILFRAVVQGLGDEHEYSEAELTGELRNWLAVAGEQSGADPVSLRRYLVDAGYLHRDSAGRAYQVRKEGRGEMKFGPQIDKLDAVEILHSAREQAALRKSEWAASEKAGEPHHDQGA